MSEPFSRAVRVDGIAKEGQTFSIEATLAERQALASFYELPSIEVLEALFTLEPSSRGEVRVSGTVHGELTQVCVVSLEPFPATVDEDVDVRFAPRAENVGARRPSKEPQTFSMADEDEPDPIVDGKVDLGALAAEFFALGLDPYPRKPGVEFQPSDDGGGSVSPFSALGGRARKTQD